jgi:hypothetical protein
MLELIHGDSWEGRGSVVLSLILVNFMNWFGSMYNRRLNGIFLNDWLNVFVNMVVDVFACDGWGCGGGVLSISNCASVLELSLLSSETLLYMRIISMFDVTVLSFVLAVRVLLWENFAILDRLDRSVVVILVNLAIYGGSDVFVLSARNIFVLNCWVDSLAN